MAIKSYYRQKLEKGKFKVEFDEETGRIHISRETSPYTFYSNSISINPKDFKVIKELVEQLDVMQGKK